MEVTVKGQVVVLRDRIPAKDNFVLIHRFEEFAKGTIEYDGIVDLLARIVEVWSYEGDPSKVESYANLDLFGELLPLMQAVGTDIQRRMVADGEVSKNSPSPST